MQSVKFDDAKAQLTPLVDAAAAGSDVVRSRNGKALVRTTRLEASKRRIKFGLVEGRVMVSSGLDARWPDEVTAELALGTAKSFR